MVLVGSFAAKIHETLAGGATRTHLDKRRSSHPLLLISFFLLFTSLSHSLLPPFSSRGKKLFDHSSISPHALAIDSEPARILRSVPLEMISAPLRNPTKERERLFEVEIRRTKGFEVKKMLEDGNCLFRAVADQVYGDPEAYDRTRQMCIDYMEKERDHFSQFVTEGFTSYCKRKRRDKVYGNNIEIQAFAEMYNRPIHIYSYSTEPINIFQGSYNTDTPPIRLSYHHGNHYNSLVDPCRATIGAGLGFSSLRGTNIDKDRVKAAIKGQQDHLIDNDFSPKARDRNKLPFNTSSYGAPA